MSLLSGEAHTQQVHRRIGELGRDSPADRGLVDHNFETGHSGVLEVGSQERGSCNLEDTGCVD